MYLDKAKKYLSDVHLIRPQYIFPCSISEVIELQQKLNVRTPKAFYEFLMWCGNGLGDIMRGSDFYYYWMMKDDSREAARVLLDANEKDPSIMDNHTIVFYMHQGYQFAYIRDDEGEDPPVYFYNEGEEVTSVENRFSDYLFALIEGANENAGPVFIFKLDSLHEIPLYDERVTSLSFNGDIKFPTVPLRVFDFPNLISLDLRYKDMVQLSPRIGELEQLTALNVNNNNLPVLPEEIGKLTNLEKLYVSHNKLHTIINILRKFPRLTNCTFDGNSISNSEIEQIKIEFPHLFC